MMTFAQLSTRKDRLRQQGPASGATLRQSRRVSAILRRPACKRLEPCQGAEPEPDTRSGKRPRAVPDNKAGEPNPPAEFNNGETRCVRETGAMQTQIFNTGCTRPCTEEHEADHAAYRGPCCSRYAAARQRAIAAGNMSERNRISQAYIDWQNTTSDFSECRADRVGLECGTDMQAALDCEHASDESRSCCTELGTYIQAARNRIGTECPGTDEACPF